MATFDVNADEVKTFSGQIATMIFSLFTGAGVLDAAHAASGANALVSIATSLTVLVPAVLTLASIASSIYRAWNMKKVPEHAIVVAPGTPQAIIGKATAA